MADKPVLGYWKIRGLGHPVRFLLHYLEVDFEDKCYEFTPEGTTDYWLAVRDKLDLPLPNLPYILDGKDKVTESRAIMKHLCRTRKPELLGKSPEIQTRIDMVDNFMYDLVYTGLIPVIYRYTEEMHNEYKELEARKLGYLCDLIKDDKWMAGEDITYVDFLAYEVLYHITVYDPKSLEKFPKLQAYLKRVEGLPAIKAYMAGPNFLKGPLYSPFAKIKI